VIVGLLACATAGTALLARSIEITTHIVLVAAAFSPYLMVGAPLAAAVFLVGERWILAGVAGALTVATLVIQLPDNAFSVVRNTDHVDVRVMSANLFEGRADPHSLVDWAREHADVVSVQELTNEELDGLSAARMDASFPYRVVEPKKGAGGSGLWSRYPLEKITGGDGSQLSLITARMQVPGVLTETIFSVVHTPGPWPWPINQWRDSMASLATTLQHTARSAGTSAVVVAGDFNSTRDMLQFRRLRRDGYQDADEQDGIGFAPTYPADSWLPPMLAIDHVLTRGCTASSVYTATIVGSDHRALMATVQIPRAAD
jgi:endonuclease/exonuclease/phosphatase (EEP) superfamily protein YafD